MNILKSSSIALVAAIAIFGSANINLESKAGADHISAICEAFIKEEVMVK